MKKSREKAWRFQKMLNVKFSVLLDTSGQAAENWNVAVYPTSYHIDGAGCIRYMAYRSLEWDNTTIKQVIERLREDDQQPVLTTTSK